MSEFYDNDFSGAFIFFGASHSQGTTFEDCVLIDAITSHWMIIKFRGEFLKLKISKKKYNRFMKNP